MLGQVLINWLVLALAVGIGAAVIPGVEVNGGFLTLLWVALLFGLVNAIVGPVLHLLAFGPATSRAEPVTPRRRLQGPAPGSTATTASATTPTR